MTPERIQRKRTKGYRMPPNTVSVTRPGKWGNPFPADNDGVMLHALSMGLDGEDPTDRATAAVDIFRIWLTGGKVNELVGLMLPTGFGPAPKLRIIQRELAGKNLACFCALDKPCHATVLLDLANAPPSPIGIAEGEV